MSLSTATNLVFLNSAIRPGTITLPLTTTIPGRTLTLKDVTGAAAASTITVTTSGSDTFEDGTTTRTITTAFGTLSLTGNGGKWYTTATSQPTSLTVSTLSTQTLAVNSTIAKAITASTVTISSLTAGVLTASTIQAPTVSSLIALTSSLQANSISSISMQVSTLQGSSISSVTLWASTINGFPVGAAFTGSTTYLSAATTNIQQALISSVSANTITTVILSTMAFNVSSINGLLPTGSGSTNFLSAAVSLMSSVTIANVAATQGYISSLVVDSFQIGSNAAFINMGDVIATSLSTIQLNTGILYTNSTLLGNTSNQTAIQFYGLQGNYNNTALAEQSTATGIQEFVVFRGSSVNDRIRMQTTGNIVFETGVSSRLWPNANSNATPALIINTLSNVGIQTASPAFPLDVAGTARTQTLSSFTLNVSSINGQTPAGLFLGSSVFLSSAQASLGLQVNISSIANFSSGSIALFSTPSVPAQFTITDTQLSTVSTTLSQVLTKPVYQAASTLTFSYTGNYQYLTTSTHWTHLYVQMWGAGGGGSNGGGGAYVQGYLPVTQNETLTLVVGLVGQYSPGWTPPTDAQGAGGGVQDAAYTGGGRSALKRNDTDVVVAGGGGGQTYGGAFGGAATWSGTAWTGNNFVRQTAVYNGSNAGGGGQTGPGISPIAAWSGGKGVGGFSATNYNGGGGGGWYGGGGSASQQSGGGGGSSYTDFLLMPTGFDAAISTAAFFASPMRTNNAGQGGFGNGLIYITPFTAVNNYKLFAFGTTLMPTMTSVDNVGAVRIWRDTIDPSWALDVGARSRFQYVEAATVSTLTINTASTITRILSASNATISSINGAVPLLPANIASTVQGLGTATYISSLSLTSTTQGLGSAGYISTASLTSTVAGLTTATSSLAASAFTGAINSISTGSLTTGSLTLTSQSLTLTNGTVAGVSTLAGATFTTAYSVTNFVGNGTTGSTDGTGTNAAITSAWGVSLVDSNGTFYAVDGNNKIRKITATGVITTVAGSGSNASTDGTGTNASFNTPTGITFDTNGNLYVVDFFGHKIRMITPAGVVTTLAGTGSPAFLNGTGTNASFNYPWGIVTDNLGNLYISDRDNGRIRKLVIATGVVTTLAGNGGGSQTDGTGTNASFSYPLALTIDPTTGTMIVADGNKIRRVTFAGVVTTIAGSGSGSSIDGVGTNSSFHSPLGVAVDSAGNIYAGEQLGYRVRKITPAGVVTTIAGSGTATTVNGTGASASFNQILGVTIDSFGNIYAFDTGHYLRKLTAVQSNPFTSYTGSLNVSTIYSNTAINAMRLGADYGVVTTLAGSGTNSDVNGTGTGASFNTPEGIVYDPFSNCLYVVGRGSTALRKVTLAGVVTTLATGMASARNGVTVDPAGNIYVVQGYNTNIVNKITPAGVVTVLAGSGVCNSIDGTGTNASFNNPYGLTCDPTGNYLYVSDCAGGGPGGNKIRRVTLAGAVVTTVAGTGGAGSTDGNALTTATFSQPQGLACDSAGNLYINDGTNKIRKLSLSGIVTTVAGSGSSGGADGVGTNATFNDTRGIVVDPATNNLYVADATGCIVRKITPDGVVTTIAGRAGLNSIVNGLGSDARLNYPTDITIDPEGNLYTTDQNGHVVRKISLVTTLHNVLISTNATITAPAISTLAFNVSSINGTVYSVFAGSTTFLSTASGAISSLNVNNLTILGTQTINSNGSLATSAYGSGVDTLALRTTLSQYNGGVASLFFGTSTVGYPLARIAALDGSIAGPNSSALIFQTALASANANTSGVNAFQFTGANQSWTAPGGVTSVSVFLWGAGGGSAQPGNAGFYGGAGAFVSGTLTVIPGATYNIIVGGAGQIALFNGAAQPATFGGGGAGAGPVGGNQNAGGSGGGRSAIQRTLSVTATGVVSGGNIVYTTSAAHGLSIGQVVILTNLSPNTFNITAAISALTSNTFTVPNNTSATGSSSGTGTIVAEIVIAAGGGGAGNSTGGTGTMGVITSGTARGVNLTGGNGTNSTGGGGGGGYYGGAGGSTNQGGSGGTSYTGASEFTLVSAINSPNSAFQAPGTANSYYIAYGASSNVAAAVQFLSGGPGLVVIVSAPSSFLSETMRISNNGFLGIGTASPSTLLDVAGTSRSQAMSTLSFNASTINGIPLGAQAVGVQTLAF